MITLSDIQRKLAECIKQCGMTQTELGRKLGIKQQTISHYVKGDIMPALDTLANLCKILDVSPAYILCYEDESGAKDISEVFEYSDGTHSVRHKKG